MHEVSIHALLRGRTGILVELPKPDQFQSTPSCEGERSGTMPTSRHWPFQSTPSCEGEPTTPQGQRHWLYVSIHALLRGRTNAYCRSITILRVSIHALLRGRTSPIWRNRANCNCFNPRPLARANAALIQWATSPIVSIHALLRGRTQGADGG